MTLESLLIRCCVNRWQQTFWFRDCQLQGCRLCTPHRDLAEAIKRMYLSRLRQHVSDLEVHVVLPVAAAPYATLLKPHAQAIFRGAPRRTVGGPTPSKQGDLL